MKAAEECVLKETITEGISEETLYEPGPEWCERRDPKEQDSGRELQAQEAQRSAWVGFVLRKKRKQMA